MAGFQLPFFRGFQRPRDDPDAEDMTWRYEAVLAGALGASVVALCFLVFDLAAGRPFWTPFVLGSAFFLSRVPGPDAPVDAVLVAGYTAVHLAVFVTFGAMAAFQADTRTRPRISLARALLLTALLFVAFELVFIAFARLFAPEMTGVLGFGRVALANALAAVAMSALVCVRLGDRGRAPRADGGSR